MKRLRILGLFLFLAILIAGLEFFRERKLAPAGTSSSTLSSPGNARVSFSSSSGPAPTLSVAKKEPGTFSALTEEPEAVERELTEWARVLRPEQREELRRTLWNTRTSGDERSLAADLLARNRELENLALLESFTLEPLPSESRTPLPVLEFEMALRARTLEGLSDNPSPQATEALERIAQQTDQVFLRDRALRALRHREGLAPSLREQDEIALRQLLGEESP